MKTHTLWSRKRDLNPYKQLGRLLCCRYTIPANMQTIATVCQIEKNREGISPHGNYLMCSS